MLIEEFKFLARCRAKQREQAERAQAQMLELGVDDSDSDLEEFDIDAHITDANITRYMKAELIMIRKASCDDKSKVAIGEPGRPVDTGVSLCMCANGLANSFGFEPLRHTRCGLAEAASRIHPMNWRRWTTTGIRRMWSQQRCFFR